MVKLADLNSDETYRFYHSQSFCDFTRLLLFPDLVIQYDFTLLNIVMERVGQTQYLHDKGDTIAVLPYCVINRQFSKIHSIKDWEMLNVIIKKADYWGLKPHNFSVVLDGSNWRVAGYTKEPKYLSGQQIHSVSRQSPSSQAFKDIGIYLLKLS